MDFASRFRFKNGDSRLSAGQEETFDCYQLRDERLQYFRRDNLLPPVKDPDIIFNANSAEPFAQVADLRNEVKIGEESNVESAAYTLGYHKLSEKGRTPWEEEDSFEDVQNTVLEGSSADYFPPVFDNLQNKMQIEVESEDDEFGHGEILNTANLLDSNENTPPAMPSERLLFTCLLKNCPYSYETFKELEEHVEVHVDEQDKPTFFCDVCGTNFFFKEDAMEHIRQRENKECCACEKQLPSCVQLVEHLRRHTGDKPFVCMACSHRFSNFDDLNSHLLAHIVEKNFFCGVCMKMFAEKEHLEVHERTHEKAFKCDHCDYRTNDTSHLNRHNGRHHKNCEIQRGPFECSYCWKKFAHEGHLRMHIPVHTKEPLSCEECGKKFYDEEWLKKHVKNKHPQLIRKGPYQCVDCIEDFATSWELALHQQQNNCRTLAADCVKEENDEGHRTVDLLQRKTPIGRRLFGCPVKDCPTSCTYFIELKKHIIEIHTDKEKDVFCDVCKKEFSSLDEGTEHVRKRAQMECCSCGKKAQSMAALLAHHRSHTKEKPFVCGLCQKRFSWKKDCQRHEATHSDEKPIVCEQNPKNSFEHYCEMPFACSFCHFRAKCLSTFTEHIKTHSGEKPYFCEKCGHGFATKGWLGRHMKNCRKE